MGRLKLKEAWQVIHKGLRVTGERTRQAFQGVVTSGRARLVSWRAPAQPAPEGATPGVAGLGDRRLLLGALMVLVLVGLLWGGSQVAQALTKPNAVAVMVNQQQVAVVASDNDFSEALAALLKENSEANDGLNMRPVDQVEVKPIRARQSEVSSEAELQGILAKELHLVAEATGIAVGGQVKVIVADQATAEKALAAVKEGFAPTGQGGAQVKVADLSFEEEVALVPLRARSDQISSLEAAVNYLRNGREEVKVYKVQQGDSLWSIARANDLWPEDLLAANPGLKEGQVLALGQEVKLVAARPLVNVVGRYQLTTLEGIPFATQVKVDGNLYRGQQRVTQEGQAGQKRVVYQVAARNGVELKREIVAEEVLKKPQPQVVIKGTRTVLASRGGGGSGQLAWPIRGLITSYFGYRWGAQHTGLDIDGETGDPVRAAEGGRVIFAGWQGGYGKLLIIDHGDGLSTYYAHLSAFGAAVGDRVDRGQVVAKVGTTGRTTGSHLHFEVRVNGSARNPLPYLR